MQVLNRYIFLQEFFVFIFHNSFLIHGGFQICSFQCRRTFWGRNGIATRYFILLRTFVFKTYKICKTYFIWLKKPRNFKISLFVKTCTVGTVKVPHPVSFIYYKIIGMQIVSGNMKYPVFRFLWCTDFLWLISSKALPKVFPHVTHWLCFEKA